MFAATSSAALAQKLDEATSVTVLFRKPAMKITSGQGDQTVFDCKDAQWLSLSSEPQIPWEVMTVLLPPNADMASLSCDTKKVKYDSVKGKWQVAPKPPMSTLQNDNPKKIWPKNKTIVDGKDIDIYSQNDFWPKQQPRILHTGKLGEYKLAQVAVPLVRYHPINNKLKTLVRMEVTLSFDNELQTKSKPDKKTVSLLKKRAHKLAYNSYASASYDEPIKERTALMDVQSSPDPNTGYAIMTTTWT